MSELVGNDRDNHKQLGSGYIVKQEPTGSVLTEVKDDAKTLACATRKWIWFTKMKKAAQRENMRERHQQFSFG